MLSAVIRSTHSYPAFPVGTRTGTPAVCPFGSSRTMLRSSQCSNAYTGYGPNCLTHIIPLFPKVWTISSSCEDEIGRANCFTTLPTGVGVL